MTWETEYDDTYHRARHELENSAPYLAIKLNLHKVTPSSRELYDDIIPNSPLVDRYSWAEYAYCVSEGYAVPYVIPTADGLLVEWNQTAMLWFPRDSRLRAEVEKMVQAAFMCILAETEQDTESGRPE